MPVPYYERGGVTIYHGDCRDVLPTLGPVAAVITDPVWPDCEHIFPGINAPELLSQALAAVVEAERVIIQIGCGSDPRFLSAVPARWSFIRTCWLEYACPSYQGRILNTGDIGYVFGTPPASKKGAHVLPGKKLATTKDAGFSRWNWDSAAKRKRGLVVADLPHPTPRKLAHVAWLVKWFGEGLVLDPFMGSGTTLRAAKDAGLPAIGIEIYEPFCEVAAKRLEQEVLAI